MFKKIVHSRGQKNSLGHENSYCKFPENKTKLYWQNHEVLQCIKRQHLLSPTQNFYARKWCVTQIAHVSCPSRINVSFLPMAAVNYLPYTHGFSFHEAIPETIGRPDLCSLGRE